MAENRDFLDDIIDISKGLDALKNPLGDVSKQVTDAVDPDAKHWNPADYKERPRANVAACLVCKHEKSSCSRCLLACPVGAVDIEDGGIDFLDSCRKCGLCAAACPTEAIFSPRLRAKKLYDDIARAASSYETAYVTCTRALKRLPRENEVLVACVGDVTAEVWFSILADYDNVSVFLPLDICTACRNTTGEEMLGEAIATAETWSGEAMGLEIDRRQLRCRKRREFERKEFVEGVKRSTGIALSKMNPATRAVTNVTQKLREHTSQITALEKSLNKACGANTKKQRRTLTQGRKLMLTTLQTYPELAPNVAVEVPECDQAKCTMCGDCVDLCPVHAVDLVGAGRLTIEPTYCVGCGLCVEVCHEHALRMAPCDPAELVVPDPEAEKKAAQAAQAKAEAAEAAASARKKLDHALDQVEKLAE